MADAQAQARGNRQKRWIETRQAFEEAAEQLVEEKGIDETTMGEIAERVGKHLQTLYRHFPTKSQLVSELFLKEFRAAIAARKTDTLSFWCEWVHLQARKTYERRKHNRRDSQTGTGDLYWVQADIYRVMLEVHVDELANGLAADFGLDLATDRRPVLVAHMLYGAVTDAVRRCNATGEFDSYIDMKVSAVQQASQIGRRILTANSD